MSKLKLLSRLRSSPTLHFLFIGALLHLGYSQWFYEKPVEIIQISSAEIAEATTQWAKTTGRLPDASQQQRIIEQLSNTEILYRQALANNYDLLPVVRRRLLNLAEFLELAPEDADDETRYRAATEAGLVQRDGMIRQYLVSAMREQYLNALAPQNIPEEDIKNYFQENMDLYMRPAKAKISHVYFGGLDQASYQRATTARETLQTENLKPETAIEKGDPFYGSYHLSNQIERQIAAQLGGNVARAALKLPLQSWSQPIESPYGYHLIWIEKRSEASEPPLVEVKADITSRIRREKRDAAFEKLMANIRGNYQIDLERKAADQI